MSLPRLAHERIVLGLMSIPNTSRMVVNSPGVPSVSQSRNCWSVARRRRLAVHVLPQWSQRAMSASVGP